MRFDVDRTFTRRRRGNPIRCARDWGPHFAKGTTLRISGLRNAIRNEPGAIDVQLDDGQSIRVRHDLSSRHADVLLTGGSIPWTRGRIAEATRQVMQSRCGAAPGLSPTPAKMDAMPMVADPLTAELDRSCRTRMLWPSSS